MPTRPYQVTVLTGDGRSSFIALARNGAYAVCDALNHYPSAREISAKPIAHSTCT